MRNSVPREQYRQEQEMKILANVKDLSDRWLDDPTDISRYLALQSRVSLKARNTIQAYAVNPNALYVATYSEYENMGYSVLPRQTGIRITYPPRTYVRKHAGKPWQSLLHAGDTTRRLAEVGAMETREDTQVLIGTVFDIAQTNCPPQDYGKIMGEPRHHATYEQIYAATVHFCEQFMPVTEKAMDDSQRGTYDPDTGCITINNQFPIAQRLSILFHEMSHGFLAPTRVSIKPVSRMEFEADALSILFSHRFGLRISDFRLQHMATSYLSWRSVIRDPDMIDQPDLMLERPIELYQRYAEELDTFIQQQMQSPEIQPIPYIDISPEQENYRLLDLWVPEVLERDYRCLRMDADGLDPVVFRWVTPHVLSISHQAEYLLQIDQRQETAQVMHLHSKDNGAVQTLSGHAVLSKEYVDQLNREFAGWLTGIHRQHLYYPTQAQTLAGKGISFEKPDIIWDKNLLRGDRTQTAAAQTAAAIRKRLKEDFPEVRFSVTSKTYVGGDSITVKWTDGPISAIVDNVIKEYQAGDFDGYTDSYNNKSIDPKLNCPGVHYVFTSRTISQERASELATFAHEHWGDSLSETQYADRWGTDGVNVGKVESSFPETWSQQNQERWAAIQKRQKEDEPTQHKTHTAEREKVEQNRQDALEWSRQDGEIIRAEPFRAISSIPGVEPVSVAVENRDALSASNPDDASLPHRELPLYPINEQTAKLAKQMNSFDDYVPGSATENYRSMVKEAADLVNKRLESHPELETKLNTDLDRYSKHLAKWLNRYYEIEAYCPSVMISGAGNFPVAKKERQNAMREKHMAQWDALVQWCDSLGSEQHDNTISGDDPNALEKLNQRLLSLQKRQEEMKSTNAYYRKNGTCIGFEGLTPEAAARIDEDIKARPSWVNQPFPSYVLTNNSAEIRRMQDRIHELEHLRQPESGEGWQFDGGRVEINREIMRIQVKFDSTPAVEMRTILKKRGFRWAPSQGAWQRQLTENGLYAVRHIPEIAPFTVSEPTPEQTPKTKIDAAENEYDGIGFSADQKDNIQQNMMHYGQDAHVGNLLVFSRKGAIEAYSLFCQEFNSNPSSEAALVCDQAAQDMVRLGFTQEECAEIELSVVSAETYIYEWDTSSVKFEHHDFSDEDDPRIGMVHNLTGVSLHIVPDDPKIPDDPPAPSITIPPYGYVNLLHDAEDYMLRNQILNGEFKVFATVRPPEQAIEVNVALSERLFVDMDGTTAQFHAEDNYLERMWEPGFFEGLKPYENAVEGLRLYMQQHPDTEVYILSSAIQGEPPSCETQKNTWLDKHLPEIDANHRIFPPVGADKTAYIPGGVRATDHLLDDYNKNLTAWREAGGHSIKFVNHINDRGLVGERWDGDRVWYNKPAEAICADLSAQLGYEAAIERDKLIQPGASIPEDIPIYRLYQLRSGDPDLFFNMSWLVSHDTAPNPNRYELVYEAPYKGETLNELYYRFNEAHPEDFTGRSMSVSDVVVLPTESGGFSAHFVDSIDFVEIPDFVQKLELMQHTAPQAEIDTTGKEHEVFVSRTQRQQLAEEYRTEAAELLKTAVPGIDQTMVMACSSFATDRALEKLGFPTDPAMKSALADLYKTMLPSEAELWIRRICNCGDYLAARHNSDSLVLQNQELKTEASFSPDLSEPMSPEP